MSTPARDLIDGYYRLLSRENSELTRDEVEVQLTLIVNGPWPATYAGELIGSLYALVALPIPAG